MPSRTNNTNFMCKYVKIPNTVSSSTWILYYYYYKLIFPVSLCFFFHYLFPHFSSVFLLLTGTTFSTRIVFWVTCPLYISTVPNPDLKIHLSLVYHYFQTASLSSPSPLQNKGKQMLLKHSVFQCLLFHSLSMLNK